MANEEGRKSGYRIWQTPHTRDFGGDWPKNVEFKTQLSGSL